MLAMVNSSHICAHKTPHSNTIQPYAEWPLISNFTIMPIDYYYYSRWIFSSFKRFCCCGCFIYEAIARLNSFELYKFFELDNFHGNKFKSTNTNNNKYQTKVWKDAPPNDKYMRDMSILMILMERKKNQLMKCINRSENENMCSNHLAKRMSKEEQCAKKTFMEYKM